MPRSFRSGFPINCLLEESKMKTCISTFLAIITFSLGFTGAAGAASKPNILVIWGDDIGVHNISAGNIVRYAQGDESHEDAR